MGDTNNFNSNPMYGNQNQDNNSKSSADIVKSLESKIEEYSKNLSNQGDIINNYAKQIKEKDEKILELENKFNALESKLQNANITQDYRDLEERISKLQSSVDGFVEKENLAKQETLKNKRIEVIDAFKEYGVNQEDVEHVINLIKQNYGFDLWNNPNLAQAKLALNDMIDKTSGTSNIPNGGYSDIPQTNSNSDQAIENAINEKWALYNQNKNK